MSYRPTRISVDLKVKYWFNGSEADGRILDISVGGVALKANQILMIGDSFRMELELPLNSKPKIDSWVTVRNINGMVAGMIFEEISDKSLDIIKDYIKHVLSEQNLGSREKYMKR